MSRFQPNESTGNPGQGCGLSRCMYQAGWMGEVLGVLLLIGFLFEVMGGLRQPRPTLPIAGLLALALGHWARCESGRVAAERAAGGGSDPEGSPSTWRVVAWRGLRIVLLTVLGLVCAYPVFALLMALIGYRI